MSLKKLNKCIFIFLIIVSGNVFAVSTDRQISIVYLKKAAAAYQLDDYELSESLIDKVDEFYETSSDSAFLKGMIAWKRDNKIPMAQAYMSAALKYDDWLIFSTSDCMSELSLLMFRTKQYAELVDFVETKYYPSYSDVDLMYIYVLCLKYRNDDRYQDILERAVKRYPYDYRFAGLYSKISGDYLHKLIRNELIFDDKDGYLEILADSLKLLDDHEKKTVMERYQRDGGSSVEVLLNDYRLNGTLDDSRILQLLNRNILESRALTAELKKSVPYLSGREIIKKAESEYTGKIYEDTNGDNFYEELYLYENGLLTGLSIDDNQDGIIELIIIFKNGAPVEVLYTDKDFIRVTYLDYPFVDEISITGNGILKVYTMIANSVRIDFLTPPSGLERINPKMERIMEAVSDDDYMTDNSVRIAEYSSRNSADTMDRLIKEWNRRDEKISVLSVYNELNGNYTYIQSMNETLMGFKDINYDELVDMKENYVNGKIVSIEADENSNGIYEYKIEFNGQQQISLWDFNEDGIYDCRVYEKDGTVYKEFSSKMDGEFDLVEKD